jgi:hypothetical protein
MRLPFSVDELNDVFARYNAAVWPAQVVLFLLALACVAGLSFLPGLARRIPFALAALWAWMGVAYHFAFFTRINPAAWGFGLLCLGASALFAWQGARGALVFRWLPGRRAAAGAALIAYALVGYPVLGVALGAQYPSSPTFGLPCPTTIFTLGVLLFAIRPVPRIVFVIPLLWALIGSVAAFSLGVGQDLGLLVAVAVVLPALVSNAPSTAEERYGQHPISQM